jgi:hypothetical protein
MFIVEDIFPVGFLAHLCGHGQLWSNVQSLFLSLQRDGLRETAAQLLFSLVDQELMEKWPCDTGRPESSPFHLIVPPILVPWLGCHNCHAIGLLTPLEANDHMYSGSVG